MAQGLEFPFPDPLSLVGEGEFFWKELQKGY